MREGPDRWLALANALGLMVAGAAYTVLIALARSLGVPV
jgi:hypothetical protein